MVQKLHEKRKGETRQMIGLIVQWIVFFITIFTLFFKNCGQGTRAENAVRAYACMTLAAGAGYLLELSASGVEAVFLARQMQCGALLFMGYFLCLFFYYRVTDHASALPAVYGLLYALALLAAVWTSHWHELVFRDVQYDGRRLSYRGGELGIFITAGCVILPVVLSVLLLVRYFRNEYCAGARRQMAGMTAVLFASYGAELLFFAQAGAGAYDLWGATGMLLADLFIWRFFGDRDIRQEYPYAEELAAARKEAEAAKEEARHAERMKSDFLTNISHEIRTPMNAIVGLSELIIEESRGRKVYDFASDIKAASSNLLAVIDDLLSLSRIENGQMELSQEEYGTEQLLEETLHLSKVTAASRGLQLRKELSKDMPCRLIGDPARIRQMITGFLFFSMQHTKRGYLKVGVNARQTDGEHVVLVFRFEDTGCGFSPEELDGIFDRFQPMEGRKEQNLESIGLGIALARRFVDLMEGTVDVTSTVGAGTVFTVCLPQRVADARTIAQQPWQKNDVRERLEQAFIVPDYRVLVVDDNKINRKVACGALEPYHFLVDEAKSGAQAIGLVQKNRYDMILMDHMMPEMDGIETTEHIRCECGENGTAPVIIALSANAYNHACEMFLSSGFQDFIAKPIDKDELHRMLCRWIGAERRQSVEGEPETSEKLVRAAETELYMSGVDIGRVLRAHSGSIEDYLELLELYWMDGEPKTALLRRLAAEQELKSYAIEVHGLKSASANIGAYEFAELAQSHELAAKEGNAARIRDDVERLLSEYGCLLGEIGRVLRAHGRLTEQEQVTAEGQLADPTTVRERLQEILSDVENFRRKDAAAKTEALLSENIEKSVRECLKETRNRLKMYEDDAAEDILRAFLGTAAGDPTAITLGDSESWRN